MNSSQAVWPVFLRISGRICARASNFRVLEELSQRGHHDWPDKRVSRQRQLRSGGIRPEHAVARNGDTSTGPDDSFRLPGCLGHTNYFVDIRINSYDTRSVTSRTLSKGPAPPPLPTDAEIAILAVLWRQGASTVREVHEALGKDSGYTTTLKLMQLMLEKGLVVRNERYRSHLYEARAPKEQTQRQIAGDLLKRAFEGSAKSLVLGALAAQPASGKDLAEIRSLLDEFEKRRGKT